MVGHRKRDQATANSGIVVELKLEDFKPFAKHGALAGLEFHIEQKRGSLQVKVKSSCTTYD
jgi:hypothetical protein